MEAITISKERRLEILRGLGSTICEACGNRKQAKMSHCRTDYFALPRAMRNALYQRYGEGYEEAYEASLAWLAEKKKSESLLREDNHDHAIGNSHSDHRRR